MQGLQLYRLKSYLKYMIRFFALSVGLLMNHAIDAAPLDLQSVLKQERQWAGLSSRKIQVGDITWHYSEGGDPKKPTVILLHGLVGTRDNWNRVARYLSPEYHVIIPDLPAQGETIIPNDMDLSVANITEKLQLFLAAIGYTQQLNFAGHATGGTIALLYTAQYPLQVNSLYLADAAGVFKSANTAYLKNPNLIQQLVVRQKGDLQRLLSIVSSKPPFIPQQLLEQQEQAMITNQRNTQRLIDSTIAMSQLYTSDSFALAAASIDVPVGIIWGQEDQILNVEVAQELQALFKRAEPPVILQGIGHLTILEADQLVANNYLKFLSLPK